LRKKKEEVVVCGFEEDGKEGKERLSRSVKVW